MSFLATAFTRANILWQTNKVVFDWKKMRKSPIPNQETSSLNLTEASDVKTVKTSFTIIVIYISLFVFNVWFLSSWLLPDDCYNLYNMKQSCSRRSCVWSLITVQYIAPLWKTLVEHFVTCKSDTRLVHLYKQLLKYSKVSWKVEHSQWCQVHRSI